MKLASSMTSFSSIHIAGISSRFTKSDLLEYFREFGQVESLNLFLDKATGKNTGFAILIAPLKTIEQVLSASSHYLKGSVLSIAPMPRQTRQQPQASTNLKKLSPENQQRKEPAAVVISSINKSTSKAEARNFFNNFGTLRSLKLQAVSQTKQKVLVEFQNSESVSKLVSEVQSNNEILMNGSKISEKNVKIISNLNDSQEQCPSPQGSSILGSKSKPPQGAKPSGSDLSSIESRGLHITLRG